MIREGDYVVAFSESGWCELVHVTSNGRVMINGNMCLTKNLIGKPFGASFDMIALEGEAKINAWDNTEMFYRSNSKLEVNQSQGKLHPGLVAKKRRLLEKEHGQVDEASLRAEIFELKDIPSNIVGVIAQPSEEDLQSRRSELLQQLAKVESEIGMESSMKLEVQKKELKSNRYLFDKNFENQKLTPDEVLKMKLEAPVEKLVETLVANSETFRAKTDQAQDKYVEGKVKRHSRKFRVVKVTSQTLGDTLYNRKTFCANKLLNMRPMDMMPQILAFGNVGCGAKVMVLESMRGFITASVMERLGGMGIVYSGGFNVNPLEADDSMVKYFNFTEEQMSVLKIINFAPILKGEDEAASVAYLEGAIESMDKRLQTNREQAADPNTPPNRIAKLEKGYNALVKRRERLLYRVEKKREGLPELKKAWDDILNNKVESLILASKYDPLATTLALFPFLRIGCPFVVFSQELGRLVELRDTLHRQYANAQLNETIYREYQILPSRTHPLMGMSGGSGYILHGIKIKESDTKVQYVNLNHSKK